MLSSASQEVRIVKEFVQSFDNAPLTYFIEAEVPGKNSTEKFQTFYRGFHSCLSARGLTEEGIQEFNHQASLFSTRDEMIQIFYQALQEEGLKEAMNEFVDFLLNDFDPTNRSYLEREVIPHLKGWEEARGHFSSLYTVLSFFDPEMSREKGLKAIWATSDLLHHFPILLPACHLSDILKSILQNDLLSEPEVEKYILILGDELSPFMDINYLFMNQPDLRIHLQAILSLISFYEDEFDPRVWEEVQEITGIQTVEQLKRVFDKEIDTSIFVLRTLQMDDLLVGDQWKKRLRYSLFQNQGPEPKNPIYISYLLYLLTGVRLEIVKFLGIESLLASGF